jgi:hypothetical protein
MITDVYESAELLDEEIANVRARLTAIARFARKHGCKTRVHSTHVLVFLPDGSVLATQTASRLVAWLGY